jgi:hypothetical protein
MPRHASYAVRQTRCGTACHRNRPSAVQIVFSGHEPEDRATTPVVSDCSPGSSRLDACWERCDAIWRRHSTARFARRLTAAAAAAAAAADAAAHAAAERRRAVTRFVYTFQAIS